MQLGMVGLGRMGANLVRRLIADGHTCVVYDVNDDAITSLANESDAISGATDLDDFMAQLDVPRAAWVMVPAAFAGDTVTELARRMDAGDIVIDGGNTYYRDDIDRAGELAPSGVHYVDVGTSGGVFGLERGFCLMIGGDDAIVDHLAPIFQTIAPGVGLLDRTPGREGDPTPGGGGLAALRAGRRRPLREDGAQRDRVRPDGRLRRGAQHLAPRRRRAPRSRDRRRDHPAARSALLPVRDRHRRRGRGVASGAA